MSDNTTNTVLNRDNINNTDIPEASPEQKAAVDEAKRPVSPAQDLRDIQNLLVVGTFPGAAAPQIVKSYNLLDQMALQVEADAAKK